MYYLKLYFEQYKHDVRDFIFEETRMERKIDRMGVAVQGSQVRCVHYQRLIKLYLNLQKFLIL